MLILWAILCFVAGIVLGFLAFGGIAIAISFFTKLLFLFSLLCFIAAFVFVFLEKLKLRRERAGYR
jgi:uncharacterized membrane protein YtjA (UPF0391 family)